MSSAPTTPKTNKDISISIEPSHPQTTDSPSISAVSETAGSNTENDNNDIESTNLHHKAYSDGNNNKSSSSSSQSSSSSSSSMKSKKKTKRIKSHSPNPSHNKSKSLTPRRKSNGDAGHLSEGTLNVDHNETPPSDKPSLDGRRKSRSNHKRKPKNFGKKVSKSVAFAMDDNEPDIKSNNGRKRKPKGIKKKRISVTPGHTIQKQLEKHLGSVNNHLLPAPKKQSYYKWYLRFQDII